MNFIGLVRKEFDTGKEITLKEIYDNISKIPDLQIKNDEIHHRIRSAVYTLKKNNEIVRTGEGKYQKLGNNP